MKDFPTITVDNFLPDSESVWKEFVGLKFYDVRGPDGATYKRVHVRDSNEFSTLIEKIVGRPIRQSYSLVRLNFEGEPPNAAIHADCGYDEVAAVLYLSKPEFCRGGTAFWRHRKTSLCHWPEEREIRAIGKSPKRIYENLEADWDNADAWEQTELAEMRFNRLILYPTKRFHSRFPFEAFGNTPEDGRLIWVSFFSVA